MREWNVYLSGEIHSDWRERIGEAVRGHKVIKVFGGRDAEMQRFLRHANWVRRYRFKEKVADAAGVPVPESLDGRSFLPVLLGKAAQHKEFTYGIHTTRGIINGSEGYRFYPDPESGVYGRHVEQIPILIAQCRDGRRSARFLPGRRPPEQLHVLPP